MQLIFKQSQSVWTQLWQGLITTEQLHRIMTLIITRYISSVLEKHSRGPTTALIESLAAFHTELTVQEFAAVVKEKAKRDDVAKLLKAYDSGKVLSSDV